MKFKIGDKVRCIKPNMNLIKNKVYFIQDFRSANILCSVSVEKDETTILKSICNKEPCWFFCDRFELEKKILNTKDNLIEDMNELNGMTFISDDIVNMSQLDFNNTNDGNLCIDIKTNLDEENSLREINIILHKDGTWEREIIRDKNKTKTFYSIGDIIHIDKGIIQNIYTGAVFTISGINRLHTEYIGYYVVIQADYDGYVFAQKFFDDSVVIKFSICRKNHLFNDSIEIAGKAKQVWEKI